MYFVSTYTIRTSPAATRCCKILKNFLDVMMAQKHFILSIDPIVIFSLAPYCDEFPNIFKLRYNQICCAHINVSSRGKWQIFLLSEPHTTYFTLNLWREVRDRGIAGALWGRCVVNPAFRRVPDGFLIQFYIISWIILGVEDYFDVWLCMKMEVLLTTCSDENRC